MKTLNWKSSVMWTALSLLFLLLALIVGPAPALAQGPDAVLYELTENMKLAGGKVLHRRATSELMGWASVGTPLCPQSLVNAVSPGATRCTINATGSDNINTGTGLGNFSGSFTVVVQGDNNTDSPEFVIAKGKFKGKMDFSPAIVYGAPYGTVVGKMVLAGGGGTVPFTGTFRLPFVLPYPDAYLSGPYGWGPLPLTPFPADTCTAQGSCTRPLYLADDMSSVFPVGAQEYGLGYATVKFEITFE